MRKRTFILFGFLSIMVMGLVIISAKFYRKGNLKPEVTEIMAPLPASLQNFFPPKSEQPIFLFRMLGMNKPFTGIIVDFFESDIANALSNFEKFKSQYIDISKMVPEWETYFPIKPLNDLERALKTGEREIFMTTFEQVGKVCSNCHRQNMPKVQHKYFWGDFNRIGITDPITRQEINNQQMMYFIEASFTGIEVDVEQGQIENARRNFQDFRTRFQTMEETCLNCHDTERYYYVDKEVKEMIEKLGEALNEFPVDTKQVAVLHQGIGMESCFKCHLVHVPAAVTQSQLVK